MGEVVEIMFGNGFPEIHKDTTPIQTLHSNQQECHWYEETIDDDLKWSFALNRFSSFSFVLTSHTFLSHFPNHSFCFSFPPYNSVLHKGTSEYQDIALLDTKRFGKVHFPQLVVFILY